MADRTSLDDRLELLKAVADPTRLAVLDSLAADGARCHGDLEVELGVPANRLSFHLKVLRDAGLVRANRHGRRVLLLTHDLRALPVVDEVVVVDGGRIVARGSHEQLLASDPAYAARLALDLAAG